MNLDNMIPYGKQDITKRDIEEVVKILQSDFLTQGPTINSFEEVLCGYTGAKFSTTVNSCTSALHIACLALDLGPGDILWTSPITFVASANCAIYCGASVDFVDIDPDTALMSVEKLKEKLNNAKKIGKLPKIIVPVHCAGQPCDMKEIHALSQEYNFKIIEDAAHAIGARYLSDKVGSCRYSDITVFSFHPVKIITTAEGGVAMTNSHKLAKKMRLLRSHGVTREQFSMTKLSDGDWYYQQIDIGFNFRMTELQAALGIEQMKRLDDYVAKRHILQKRYNSMLNNLPLTTLHQNHYSYSALHLYTVQINKQYTNKNRKQIFNELRENNIGVNVHYIPVHTQPYYLNMGFDYGDFPNAESYYLKTISLPMFPKLSFEDQDRVIHVLKSVIQ